MSSCGTLVVTFPNTLFTTLFAVDPAVVGVSAILFAVCGFVCLWLGYSYRCHCVKSLRISFMAEWSFCWLWSGSLS